MKLGIIDYGSGNLHSVEHALVHAAAEIKGASSIERVTTAAELGMCDQIVLPGAVSYTHLTLPTSDLV